MQSGTRSAWTCENCRRRKVRCNSENPCKHCIRREEECRWPENAQVKQSPTQLAEQAQAVETLQSRLDRLEALFDRSGILSAQSAADERHDTTLRRSDLSTALAVVETSNVTNFEPQASPAITRSYPPQRRRDHQILSGSAKVHSIDDRPTNGRSVKLGDLAAADHSNQVQLVHKHDDFDHHIIDGSLPKAAGTHHQSATTTSQDGDLMSIARLEARSILARSLPSRRQADELLESYLKNVEWMHHPLLVPTFRSEYDTFWRSYRRSDDLPNTQWLALLFIVLCLGSHFDADHQYISREEDLYSSSQELLTLSNHLANHSVLAIQTLLLMGLYLNNRGLSNTHHAQLALAIKMAMNLGISKLDDVSTTSWNKNDSTFFSSYHVPLSPSSDAQKELKRRLWWSLVCQDYYTASNCNFTYSINPRQCKTNLFSNLDEEDLPWRSDGISNVVVPDLQRVATSASYHLLKIPFVRVAKSMTDLYNDDALTYEAVLDLEKLLWRTYDELPEHFRWQPGNEAPPTIPASLHVDRQHLEWQRLFLGFTVHNRVLRLHRPFMVNGYSDSTMLHSRQATTQSALACLALAEQGQKIDFPGLRWWVVLIHIFTAGVALCIDYHYLLQYQRQTTVSDELRQLIRSRRDQISRTAKILHTANQNSVAASRAISVIHSLIKQAEDHKANSSSIEHSRNKRSVEDRASSPAPLRLRLGTDISTPRQRTNSRNAPNHQRWPESQTTMHTGMMPAATSYTSPMSTRSTSQSLRAHTPSFSGANDVAASSITDPIDDACTPSQFDFGREPMTQTLDQDWLDTLQLEDWSGPDWAQLLASMSADSYSPQGGIGADLYNTVSSFASNFMPG